jgi:hypothetical protein
MGVISRLPPVYPEIFQGTGASHRALTSAFQTNLEFKVTLPRQGLNESPTLRFYSMKATWIRYILLNTIPVATER